MWHAGPVPIRIQALFIVAGIVLAIVVAERRFAAAGGRDRPSGVITDIAVWAVLAGLIPAALGSFLAPVHSGFWQGVRTWDDALGFPGAAALGTLAAWAACRRMSGRWRFPRRPRRPRSPGRPGRAGPPRLAQIRNRDRDRVKLSDVAGAVAPAMAFGYAVAELGSWAAQEGYGQPSSLWWAVEISPAHRLPGYENFATFQPVFGYEALWAVTTGIGILWLTRRLTLTGDRVFAVAAAAYAAGGFALFWLGIGHLPVVLGLRAGELGDAVVLVGAAAYLARTRRKRNTPFPPPQKAAMERDSPVM
jgi:prolipoprotein diacylglyceryltransferase